jgi:hypothetical protein
VPSTRGYYYRPKHGIAVVFQTENVTSFKCFKVRRVAVNE